VELTVGLLNQNNTHPGIPAAIAIAAFTFFAGLSTAAAQVSNNSVSGGAGVSGVSGYFTDSTPFPLLTGSFSSSRTLFEPDYQNTYARVNAYSDVAGPVFYASSFASGAAGSAGASIYKEFTLTAQQSGQYSMNSFLASGYLTAALRDTDLYYGNGKASFDWSVYVNNNQVNNSYFDARVENGISVVEGYSTFAFNAFQKRELAGLASVAWADTNVTTDLGYLNAGESVNILMTFGTSSQANYYSYDPDLTSDEAYGCPTTTLADGVAASNCGFSATSFGDPSIIDASFGTLALRNSIYSMPSGLQLAVTSAIPEPAEWAMMLAGLSVVAGLAKRRRKASAEIYGKRI
jgi:hypothetical protein